LNPTSVKIRKLIIHHHGQTKGLEKGAMFAKGSWIVHLYYGIGQIKRLEKKCLEGKKTIYYRVEGKDGTFWLPVNKADTKRVRPIASKKQLNSAIEALKEQPRTFTEDYKQRQTFMNESKSKGSLFEIACLVRDLSFWQVNKHLNLSEKETLEHLKNRLSMEWSIVSDIKQQEALTKLNELLVSQIG
jgi:CarD family transcriptional regulator